MASNFEIRQANYEKIKEYFEQEYVKAWTHVNIHQVPIRELLKICQKNGEHKEINLMGLVKYLKKYYDFVEVVAFLDNETQEEKTYILIRE